MLKQVEIDASKIQRVKTSRENKKNTSPKSESKSEIVIEIISSEYKREEYREKTCNELKRQIF